MPFTSIMASWSKITPLKPVEDKPPSDPTPENKNSKKRKANTSAYDFSNGDEDTDDDDPDEVIPAVKPASSSRPGSSRSLYRPPTIAPPTSTGRRSITSGRMQARRNKAAPDTPVLLSNERATPLNDAVANLARANAPDAARIQSDNRVPEAPMGGLNLLDPTTATAPLSSLSTSAAPSTRATPFKARGKARAREPVAEPAPKPEPELEFEEEEPEEKQEPEPQQQQQSSKTKKADEEQHEIVKLLDHRMDKDGTVNLLVHWAGESKDDASWQDEAEIQNGGAEALYDYWKKVGGRSRCLFENGRNREEYFMFRILGHEKTKNRPFKYRVQWVGYSHEPRDTTVELEKKVKDTAPELLPKYWNTVPGGREGQLEKPGGGGRKKRKH
ncbi:hypothetical protein F5Y18DRAFT_376600 [Xylariaceae sp. FL1019]|nr:hypothetical protein F5Y18DRAFT_376600 [Xylariaceae sp. FL1019]